MSNVVVTGSSRGIGAAVAEACRARGDRVFGIDLGADFCCDASDADQVEAAAVAAFDELGVVDLVLHAAGVSALGRPVPRMAPVRPERT